jgi:hypothetical protein
MALFRFGVGRICCNCAWYRAFETGHPATAVLILSNEALPGLAAPLVALKRQRPWVARAFRVQRI